MLQINDLTFTAWGRTLLSHAQAAIPATAKVGLVGRNGVGKTTLFRVILGELPITEGSIGMPARWRVATVDQEAAASPIGLLDTVLAADEERARLLVEAETADPEHLGEIHARLNQIGASRAPARASEILVGLGFSNEDLERPMAEFSGGWRMRAALAAALFAEPDLLLLDEPTNYLDLEGALWLEAKLKRYPNAAIIISHDRELLNTAVDHILHLHDGKLDLYAGGYDAFETERAERLRLQAAANAKIEAQRAHMQAFVDRFRYKESKARQAQSRVKMLAKLPPAIPIEAEHTQGFTLPSPDRPLAPPMLRLENAQVGYGGPPILSKLNLRMDADDRIGLLGVNGAGKSTFAKLLAEALPLTSGGIHRSAKMRVAWFHQHQIEALDPEETPLDLIRREMPELTEAQRRSILARFGLPASKAGTKHSALSGGERARLLLNLVAREAPHLLILDEPTNHLDIDSRRALLDALNDYQGAVILITHDRSLMELVADRLWLTADGTIRPFDGDMDDYARHVLDRARQSGVRVAPRAPEPKAGREARKAAADARAAIAPLKRQVDAAEKELEKQQDRLAKCDQALAEPGLFQKNPQRATELGKLRALTLDLITKAEAEWLAAAEAYEQAQAMADA